MVLDKEKAKKSHPHEGHRQRMKNTLLSDGAGNLSETDILEMLLFYVLPRCDTRAHAKALLEKFGSLESVLKAEKGEISTVSGLKDGAEVLFALLRELLARYGNKLPEVSLLEPDRMKKHLIDLYRDITAETVYALYFTKNGSFLSEQLIFRGGISSARFSLRAVTEGVILAGGSAVVLAHNHPSDNLIPSGEDILSTKRIAAHLAANDIDLIEHYIVGKTDCIGIIGVK